MPLTKDAVLNGGMGGSEGALCFSARALSLAGNSVEIICPCEEEFDVDSVKFIPISKGSKNRIDNADIVISFRDIELCDEDILIGKILILWIHDGYSNFWFDKNVLNKWYPIITKKIGRIFVLSKWQKSRFKNMFKTVIGREIDENLIYLTRNGMPFEFEEQMNIKKNADQLIFTGIINRGFYEIPEILDLIKSEICNVKLKVCTSYPKEKDMFFINYPEIEFLGKLNRIELRKTLWESSIFIYPNYSLPFPIGAFGAYAETSCIIAMEAMACKTPIIASHRGAISETVPDGLCGELIKGDPLSNTDYDRKFADSVIGLLKDKDKLNKFGENARKYAIDRYVWSKIIKEWENEFELLLKGTAVRLKL